MTPNVRSVACRMWAVIALSTTALGTTVVLAQTPSPDPHPDAVVEQTPAATAMLGCQNMRGDQEAMIAKMAAETQKLTDLVAKMNAAKGDAKMAAIAAVVAELAAQRTRMPQSMPMPGGMMKKAPGPEKGATDVDHAAHYPEK